MTHRKMSDKFMEIVLEKYFCRPLNEANRQTILQQQRKAQTENRKDIIGGLCKSIIKGIILE